MLAVEVLKRGVLLENIHALSLAEDHADGAVFKHQPRFSFKEYAHLLVQHQLNQVLFRLT